MRFAGLDKTSIRFERLKPQTGGEQGVDCWFRLVSGRCSICFIQNSVLCNASTSKDNNLVGVAMQIQRNASK